MPHSVSVVTVNFNQPAVTEALLASIAAHNTYADLEIIVVDNGSQTNPVPAWKIEYPGATFIRSEKNTGFAGGNNIGIRIAKGDYLFLVNNDTEFTPGLVEQLVATLDANPNIGIVSPKIRYFDQPDILQYAGFTPMNYYTARNKCIGQYQKDNGQYDNSTGPTGFAHGAAMLVRSSAIAKAGLMAEHFFLYYEEMDWCEHIRRADFDIWVNTKALIYHKESVSVGAKSPLKEYFMNRNRILFVRRNSGGLKKYIFAIYFLFVVTPRNIVGYIKDKKPAFIKILAKAIWWNLTRSTNSQYLGYPIKR